MRWEDTPCSVFEGSRCLATGALNEAALIAKMAVDRGAALVQPPPVLVFDDTTSDVIELDWRGTTDAFVARFQRLAQSKAADASCSEPDAAATTDAVNGDAPRARGRPKLGVVAREVTLLPRHWAWLADQPGGASVALRKLVELARRSSEDADRVRQARAVGYKFMSTMAGHEAGFEEASRALFAGDRAAFDAQIAGWPADVQAHLKKLLAAGFPT